MVINMAMDMGTNMGSIWCMDNSKKIDEKYRI